MPLFFFFNDTATTEIYTLSLHELFRSQPQQGRCAAEAARISQSAFPRCAVRDRLRGRSEEHTSELQSLAYLVCRLLLEKKKKLGVVGVSGLHGESRGRLGDAYRRSVTR